MTSLAEALTAEHHEIDAEIDAFVHGLGQDQALAELATPLLNAMTALRRHIYLEEVFAFPPIREGGLIMPIMVMEREHGVLWRQMDELQERIERVNEGDDASDDRVELITLCTEMLRVLEEHNSKEEPIVYPHLDSELDQAQTAELNELLATGTLPTGWVCARASESFSPR